MTNTDNLVIIGSVLMAICLLMIVLTIKSAIKQRRDDSQEAAEELSRLLEEDAER